MVGSPDGGFAMQIGQDADIEAARVVPLGRWDRRVVAAGDQVREDFVDELADPGRRLDLRRCQRLPSMRVPAYRT
jgi:hypothetical protein